MPGLEISKQVADKDRVRFPTACGCQRCSWYLTDDFVPYWDDCLGSASKGNCICCETASACVLKPEVPTVCCKCQGRECCMDGRVALPTDDEIPCALACCGILFYETTAGQWTAKGLDSTPGKPLPSGAGKLLFPTQCACERLSFYIKEDYSCYWEDCLGGEASGVCLCCQFSNSCVIRLEAPKVCYTSAQTCLCCDQRTSLPTTDDHPYAWAICGILLFEITQGAWIAGGYNTVPKQLQS